MELWFELAVVESKSIVVHSHNLIFSLISLRRQTCLRVLMQGLVRVLVMENTGGTDLLSQYPPSFVEELAHGHRVE